MRSVRILGIDFGEKRIGIAISDPLGITAQSLEVISRQSDEGAIKRIIEIIQHYEVNAIVCGLPKNMDGTIGEKGEYCRRFSKKLEEHTKLPLTLWDERLTTKSAQQLLIAADVSRAKRKQVVDKMAAALILQSYMDAKGRHNA